jgi:hypothetical protein
VISTRNRKELTILKVTLLKTYKLTFEDVSSNFLPFLLQFSCLKSCSHIHARTTVYLFTDCCKQVNLPGIVSLDNMQLASTLCFLFIARIHARNVGDPMGLSLRGAGGPTEGDQGEGELRGLVELDTFSGIVKGSPSAFLDPGDESCVDVPNWYSSNGPAFSCDWYRHGTFCESFGDGYENQGHTGNSACCVCGGGSSESPAPPAP